MLLCLLGEVASYLFFLFYSKRPTEVNRCIYTNYISLQWTKIRVDNVKDQIRKQPEALFKVFKHSVKIWISLQVQFSLNRESEERAREDRATG